MYRANLWCGNFNKLGGRGIHIVGLNFDKTHPKMTALLAEQKSLREKRAVEIGHKLEKAGVPNAYEGAKALANGR